MDAVVRALAASGSYGTVALQLTAIERVAKIDKLMPDIVSGGIFRILQSLLRERSFDGHKFALTTQVFSLLSQLTKNINFLPEKMHI